MEETEYRDTYHDYNQRRCLFEKSILSRKSMCEYAHRFNLADREGVGCTKQAAHERCSVLLTNLRNNARFALKQTKLDEPLPHAKEIKVQTGGLLGLRSVLTGQEQTEKIENIYRLVQQAIDKYGDLGSLPYEEITRSIVTFEGRSRRRAKR
jgi:hypothetical protein